MDEIAALKAKPSESSFIGLAAAAPEALVRQRRQLIQHVSGKEKVAGQQTLKNFSPYHIYPIKSKENVVEGVSSRSHARKRKNC